MIQTPNLDLLAYLKEGTKENIETFEQDEEAKKENELMFSKNVESRRQKMNDATKEKWPPHLYPPPLIIVDFVFLLPPFPISFNHLILVL